MVRKGGVAWFCMMLSYMFAFLVSRSIHKIHGNSISLAVDPLQFTTLPDDVKWLLKRSEKIECLQIPFAMTMTSYDLSILSRCPNFCSDAPGSSFQFLLRQKQSSFRAVSRPQACPLACLVFSLPLPACLLVCLHAAVLPFLEPQCRMGDIILVS
jgi:hypothetical protein